MNSWAVRGCSGFLLLRSLDEHPKGLLAPWGSSAFRNCHRTVIPFWDGWADCEGPRCATVNRVPGSRRKAEASRALHWMGTVFLGDGYLRPELNAAVNWEKVVVVVVDSRNRKKVIVGEASRVNLLQTRRKFTMVSMVTTETIPLQSEAVGMEEGIADFSSS